MEKLYRFSPIENEDELRRAIEYTHFACFKLSKLVFGKYLPVAGNAAIFCHHEEEYNFLTDIRKKLTDESDTLFAKYYHLKEPLVVLSKDDVPETTYTHLYIRKPDANRPQVGDVDFLMEKDKYAELKQLLLGGKEIKGARVFERQEPDMIELYDPDIDALAYVRTK